LITTKNNGFEFLDFLDVKETELYNFHRLAGSYAVLKCDDKYLLCYNTLRNQWELPAGQRGKNETSKECAIRELFEETGQSVSKIDFKGLLKVKNVISDEIKYNPVFFTTLEKLQPFQKNNETSEITLWDLKQQIGCIDEVDIKVFDFIK
jgi:8-oxo-dGTP diphosphatase